MPVESLSLLSAARLQRRDRRSTGRRELAELGDDNPARHIYLEAVQLYSVILRLLYESGEFRLFCAHHVRDPPRSGYIKDGIEAAVLVGFLHRICRVLDPAFAIHD